MMADGLYVRSLVPVVLLMMFDGFFDSAVRSRQAEAPR
jgi:hypothetical protein